MGEEAFDLELYKSLRQEFETYSTYQQNLWRVKFITIGSIVAFFFSLGTEAFNLFPGKEELFVVFILTLPVLSFYLDIKIVEVTLHLRAISEFIMTEFNNFRKVSKWEKSIWSHNKFHLTRKIITVVSAIGSSLLILGLSVYLMLNVQFENSAVITRMIPFVITFSLIAVIVGIGGAIWSSNRIKT